MLVIQVLPARDALVGTTKGEYYRRQGRSTLPMQPDDVERAIRLRPAFDWTSEVLDLNPIDSLDPKALRSAQRHFENARASPSVVGTLSFLEAIDATLNGRLTRGALLLLGKRDLIRRHVGAYEYRFTWKTPEERAIVNEVWDGCIWDVIHNLKRLFSGCNQIISVKTNGTTRNASLLDEEVFHEAVVNAIVHRDYSVDGMVSVNYFDRAIRITNPGSFFGGVSPENIAKHEPRHRNRGLARMLMKFGIVDRAGFGVKRIALKSLQYGRRFPTFKENDASVEVTIEAQKLRVGILELYASKKGEFGIPELLILNSLYEVGCIDVDSLLDTLRLCSDDPWNQLLESLTKMSGITLLGSNDGVFVAASREWAKFLDVEYVKSVTSESDRHIKLFKYLRRYGPISSREVAEQFAITQVVATRWLGNAKYARKIGAGPNVKWKLAEKLESFAS